MVADLGTGLESKREAAINDDADEHTDDIVLEPSTSSGQDTAIETTKVSSASPRAFTGGSKTDPDTSVGSPGLKNSGRTNQPRQADSALWLIKSGERILGPFKTDEIIEKVRAHELVVIDEIAAPASRWKYLRDEPSFALVVEETRRAQMATREDTEVQLGADAAQGTRTSAALPLDSSTQTSTLFSDRLASETRSGISPHDVDNVQDAEFTEEVIRPSAGKARGNRFQGDDKNQTSDIARARAASDEGPRYGFGDVGKGVDLDSSLQRRSRWIWVLTSLVVAGIALFWYKQTPTVANHAVDNQEEFKKTLSLAESAWALGDLERAFAEYSHADQLIPGNPDVTVRLAPLMMKLDGQTVLAKRNLQDLMQHTADAGLQKEAQLGLGLAALLTEDFPAAEKIYGDLLAISPNDAIARYNLGVAKFLKGDLAAAALDFTEVLRTHQDLGAATLMLALSHLNQGGENLKNASEVLDAYLTAHFDYRQEAQVLSSYVIATRGNKAQALATAGMAVETDPYLTGEHRHDPWLDLDPLSPIKLLKFIHKLRGEPEAPSSPSPTLEALLAIYQTKAKLMTEAEKTIADGLAAKPNDPDLLSANAFLMMQTGRDTDAQAILSVAAKDGAKLALVLTGRNCRALHDVDCANAAWLKLMKAEPPSLVALIGRANQLYIDKNSPEKSAEALQDLVKVESLSPHYLPAIRLREKVSGR